MIFDSYLLWVRIKTIISDVYFDRAGYGSKQRTLSEAREKDKTITMGDINEFFEQKRKTSRSKQFFSWLQLCCNVPSKTSNNTQGLLKMDEECRVEPADDGSRWTSFSGNDPRHKLQAAFHQNPLAIVASFDLTGVCVCVGGEAWLENGDGIC